MNLEECKTLEQLWKHVQNVHQKNYPNHELAPILGNGKTKKPKIMFVFINPTKRNISSDKSWKGPRYPFIGTKQIWRIFNRAEIFDNNLMSEIEKNKEWSLELTNKVLEYFNEKQYYITNIVKWTGHDATLPNKEKIKLFLPLLKKEIEIVQPKYIITFGLIPFEALTNQKIKLEDYYKRSIKENKLNSFDLENSNSKIIPCYFPIGRGNPKRAVELMKLLKKM